MQVLPSLHVPEQADWKVDANGGCQKTGWEAFLPRHRKVSALKTFRAKADSMLHGRGIPLQGQGARAEAGPSLKE